MQSDIVVNGNQIIGTLINISDGSVWDSGAWSAAESTGHFIFLKATGVPEGAVSTIELYNGTHPAVTLDSDPNAVLRIANKDTQKIILTVKYNGVVETKTYGLKGLTLAE